jgi:hypothetical protein
MNLIFYRSIIVIAIVLTSLAATAQSTIAVKATADRTAILIGEPLSITLEADIPENAPIRFFLLDSIPHFEYLEKQKIDTVNTGDGTVLTQIIKLTSFDSGHWVIPAFILGDSLQTDTIPVDIGFATFNKEQPYHDIKDIIEADPEEEQQKKLWWYIAGSAVLLILLIWMLLRKKKKPVIQTVIPPADPYKEAMEQLAFLKQQKPGAKEYYSSVVDIFRRYAASKKGIHSLQKTSDDLLVQLRSIELPKETFEELAKYLRLSDFVKFAKYIPSPEDDEKIWQQVKNTIQQIEQLK